MNPSQRPSIAVRARLLLGGAELGQQQAAVALTAADGPAERGAGHALAGGSLLVVELPGLLAGYRLGELTCGTPTSRVDATSA